ncbi:hypothetical protein K474DRAFT_1668384 [Panus rudis PR-1116 ss-1]|nr:hypothetical protein K474DRAFT_1668384 [Panus rudis PR-1116 ss-1]
MSMSSRPPERKRLPSQQDQDIKKPWLRTAVPTGVGHPLSADFVQGSSGGYPYIAPYGHPRSRYSPPHAHDFKRPNELERRMGQDGGPLLSRIQSTSSVRITPSGGHTQEEAWQTPLKEGNSLLSRIDLSPPPQATSLLTRIQPREQDDIEPGEELEEGPNLRHDTPLEPGELPIDDSAQLGEAEEYADRLIMQAALDLQMQRTEIEGDNNQSEQGDAESRTEDIVELERQESSQMQESSSVLGSERDVHDMLLDSQGEESSISQPRSPIDVLPSSSSQTISATMIEEARRLIAPILFQTIRRRDPVVKDEDIKHRITALLTEEHCRDFIRLAKETRLQLSATGASAEEFFNSIADTFQQKKSPENAAHADSPGKKRERGDVDDSPRPLKILRHDLPDASRTETLTIISESNSSAESRHSTGTSNRPDVSDEQVRSKFVSVHPNAGVTAGTSRPEMPSSHDGHMIVRREPFVIGPRSKTSTPNQSLPLRLNTPDSLPPLSSTSQTDSDMSLGETGLSPEQPQEATSSSSSSPSRSASPSQSLPSGSEQPQQRSGSEESRHVTPSIGDVKANDNGDGEETDGSPLEKTESVEVQSELVLSSHPTPTIESTSILADPPLESPPEFNADLTPELDPEPSETYIEPQGEDAANTDIQPPPSKTLVKLERGDPNSSRSSPKSPPQDIAAVDTLPETQSEQESPQPVHSITEEPTSSVDQAQVHASLGQAPTPPPEPTAMVDNHPPPESTALTPVRPTVAPVSAPPQHDAVPGLWFVKAGRDIAAILKVDFHVNAETAEAAKRWESRYDGDEWSSDVVKLYLLCLPVSEITEIPGLFDQPLEERMNSLWNIQTQWPELGSLIIEHIVENGETTRRWFPRELRPTDGPLEISGSLRPGINTIRFIQLDDLHDRVFILHATRPTEEENEKYREIARKNAIFNDFAQRTMARMAERFAREQAAEEARRASSLEIATNAVAGTSSA